MWSLSSAKIQRMMPHSFFFFFSKCYFASFGSFHSTPLPRAMMDSILYGLKKFKMKFKIRASEVKYEIEFHFTIRALKENYITALNIKWVTFKSKIKKN